VDLRFVMSALALALTLLAGAWVRAEFVLTDRVRQVALGANSLCGGMQGLRAAAPGADEFVRRFSSLATLHGLEARDVRVRLEALRPGQGGLMGGVMAQMGAITGGAFKTEATQVTVEGTVWGEKWLWSIERPLTGTCVAQGKVERVMPSRTFGEE
jgi:hypothetical protein